MYLLYHSIIPYYKGSIKLYNAASNQNRLDEAILRHATMYSLTENMSGIYIKLLYYLKKGYILTANVNQSLIMSFSLNLKILLPQIESVL